MFKVTIEPRYSETDALGHINNTVLPIWFEFARNDMFELVHPAMTHHDWPLILAKIDVSFIQQIYFGKPVEVTTGISKLGGKSFTLHHQAFQNNQLVAEGHAVLVWFDHQQQTSNLLPDETRALLEEHLTEQ